MDRYYFYIDFEDGNGFIRITEYDLNLSLIKRRTINDIIQRDFLEGTFKISGTQSALAQTAFITNSKYKIPMRIYEWGVSGVGTLIWEGKARIKSKFDFNRNYVELTSFETTDIYTPIIDILEKAIYWSQINFIDGFTITTGPIQEGVHANCNKIQTFDFDGTDFSTNGTPYSLPILGRNAIGGPQNDGDFVIFDAISGSLTRYNTSDSGLTYSPSTSGTKKFLTNAHRCASGALCFFGNSQVTYVDDFHNELRRYLSITGDWTLEQTLELDVELKNPELVFLYSGASSYFALINAKNGTISRVLDNGSSYLPGKDYSIGDIENPKGSLITSDATNPIFCMVDSKTQTLRTFRYDSGWEQYGSSISIGNVKAPCIAKLDTNVYAVYDNYTGVLQAYTWSTSGLSWSKTGNPFTYSGGYFASMMGLADNTVTPVTNRLVMISSDSYKLATDTCFETSTLLNGILQYYDAYETDGIGMSETDHEATFDPIHVFWGALDVLQEYPYREDTFSLEKVSIKQILDLIEQMFQNYWYLKYDPEGTYIDYQIKFAQPDTFSSIGSDIDVSGLTSDLNIREYLEEILIERENMTMNNAFNSDFTGNLIEYGRDTGIQNDTGIAITTDWEAAFDSIRGLEKDFQFSGLFAILSKGDGDYGVNYVSIVIDNETGPTGSTNVKNGGLSKARLQEDYMKDYRYTNAGSFTLNGSSVSVQNTCRKIIDFPDVEKVLSAYPGDLASLDWGSGIKSFITEAQTELKTGKTIFRSTLLDI